MFTIKECTQKECACSECGTATVGQCPLNARLGGNAAEGDRIFVLNENGPRAIGVLGLRHGKVIVKGVFGDLDEAYRDLMVRALLNVCSFFAPITVRVDEVNDYYKRFGFTEKDGGMEVQSNAITFHC